MPFYILVLNAEVRQSGGVYRDAIIPNEAYESREAAEAAAAATPTGADEVVHIIEAADQRAAQMRSFELLGGTVPPELGDSN